MAVPALLAASLAAPSARADGTEPIRISVTAPPGCPDTDAFSAEVSARTAKARPAAAGEAARSFTVTITASGKKARGTLVIDDPRGPGGAREMSGNTCAEVASALALVTALAIDPKASTAAKPPPPPPKPPPPKPAVLPRDPKQLPPFTPLPWWGPIGAPLPALLSAAPSARWRVAAALHAGAASAIAPGMTLVLSGGVDVARVGGGILSPAFRLSVLTADSGEHAVGTNALLQARYRWSAARIEGCPVRLPIVGPLAVSPCVHFEAGALRAGGLSPFVPGALPRAQRLDTTRPWIAPGILGRLQIDVLDELLIEVSGGVNFPLVRDTFYFGLPPSTASDVNAHQVPVAGGFVSAGVGMHFP